jgi:LPS-assembly lipoprotein
MRIVQGLMKVLIVAGGAALLGGCLRPLHAPMASDAAGSAVARQMSDVAIELSGDRLAHYFRNELEFELRGGATAAPVAANATYRLAIVTRQVIGSTLLDRQTGLADAAQLSVSADYKLFKTGKTEPVASGRAIAGISYERSQQRFATIRAARDAEIQAARQLAEQVRTRLAAYFTTSP